MFSKGSQAHYLADNMDADNKGKSLEDGGDKLAHLAHHPRAHHRRQHSLQLAPHHIMTSHQPRVTLPVPLTSEEAQKKMAGGGSVSVEV